MTVFIGLKYDVIGLHLMQSVSVDAIRFKLIALNAIPVKFDAP
jgi:hypothetical protein